MSAPPSSSNADIHADPWETESPPRLGRRADSARESARAQVGARSQHSTSGSREHAFHSRLGDRTLDPQDSAVRNIALPQQEPHMHGQGSEAQTSAKQEAASSRFVEELSTGIDAQAAAPSAAASSCVLRAGDNGGSAVNEGTGLQNKEHGRAKLDRIPPKPSENEAHKSRGETPLSNQAV